MTYIELSQIKEEDVIYDESAGIAYNVIKLCKSGILTYRKWDNTYGFTECKYLKYEELLDKNMILKKNTSQEREERRMNKWEEFEDLKDFVSDIISIYHNFDREQPYLLEDLEVDFDYTMEKWSKKIEHYKWGKK